MYLSFARSYLGSQPARNLFDYLRMSEVNDISGIDHIGFMTFKLSTFYGYKKIFLCHEMQNRGVTKWQRLIQLIEN